MRQIRGQLQPSYPQGPKPRRRQRHDRKPTQRQNVYRHYTGLDPRETLQIRSGQKVTQERRDQAQECDRAMVAIATVKGVGASPQQNYPEK